MPNYCNDTVKITADKATIKKIEQSLNSKNDDTGFLNVLYPMPKELAETVADGSRREKLIKKYGHSDWYGWRTANWGTKWEVSESYSTPEISADGETIEFGFDSAWAPPIGAYEHFLSQNKDASLFATYYEPGCDFMGIWDSGNDRSYNVSDYNSTDDFWLTEDGALLDSQYGIVESLLEFEAEAEEDVTKYVKGKAVNMEIGEEV